MMNKSNKKHNPVFTLLLLTLFALPTTAWAMESHDTPEEETSLTAEQFDFSNLETTPEALKDLFQQIGAGSVVAAEVHATPLDDTALEHLLEQDDYSHDFLVPAAAPAPAPNPLGYNTNLLAVAPSSEPTETSHSVTPATYSSTPCIIDDDDDEEDCTFEDTEPAADHDTHALAMTSKHSVASKPKPRKRRRTLCPASKKFVCNEANCWYRTNKNSDLKKHIRTHTGERPFQCPECNASFTTKSSLKSHIHSDTGKRPFMCEQCGAGFTAKSSLSRHMRTHTGEKPFKCKQCGTGFNRKDYIKTHMRIHTDAKPFKCKKCGTTFARQDNLKTHMHIHTGVKPFKCETCGTFFSQNSHLRRHMRTRHPSTPAKPDHDFEEDDFATDGEHDDE